MTAVLLYAKEVDAIQSFDSSAALVDSDIPEENFIISQNHKTVQKISSYRIDKIYQGDLYGDGYEELVLGIYLVG